MATLEDIVIDAENPAALAAFWAQALDGYQIRPYDDEELARLAARGLTPATDPAVAVDGPGPTLFFQITQTKKTQRNRVHVDLAAGASEEELARLQQLGARIRDRHDSHCVLLDPEGNEFCLKIDGW